MIAYCRNKSLRDKIGDTTIENNRVVRKQKPMLKSAFQEQTTFVAKKL